ncbi:46 kDa FK506-binding nuclear protein [Tribolium madens]|uniref:46 kDa FK506-binding nuclear protein n=1 Tax=Tribolium madens TaxID=41895 RepID=UPI001CF72516|nr:46 kDa FK506-binding nuclear protein [Tribolium madens]
MFWGLIMEPGRCYTQTVKVAFHVSMAALDISNSGDEPAQIMCVFEGRNYLLCTLSKEDKWQCALDLNFEIGSKVSFATNGKSHVHLTGYLTGLDDELEEEEVEEEEVPKLLKKRTKMQHIEEPPSKKSKALENSIEEEEEDESDSDFDLGKVMQQSEDEEDSDEEVEEEEELSAWEEEASSLSDKESEEEKEVKPKQNGIAKPTPKKKKNEEKPKQEEKKEKQKPKPKQSNLKGGVVIQDIKEGSGDVVKDGKFVHVYYEGRLKENNKMFDSTTKGPGFSFRVGKGEVIKGWDVGLIGMKVGGKRRIICPPKMAYGPKGSPPVIPPNANLIFDVEVKKVS